jgi:ABC-type branched-subunit amino acid transport system permease subunit
MPDIGVLLDQHRSELIALLAGVLGALAFLALIRKAIKWFIILLLLTAVVTAWWLSHEQDLFGGAKDLVDLLR